MVDMAHFAGLVAAELFPTPLPHAHVVTTTTHKTLRGPRGGMILANDAEIGRRINSAVFPGLQGGPLMHVIAGKAAAFGEALRPEFRNYQKAVADNAKVLAETLTQQGLAIVTGGTDCHLILVDLRPKHVTARRRRPVWSAPASPPTRMQFRSTRKAGHHVGYPAGFAGGNLARLRRNRVPRDRLDDRRGAGRPLPLQRWLERCGRSCRGGPRPGAVCPLPAISCAVAGDALPVLRTRGHAGEGQSSERGRRRDSAPALLRQLRPAFHDH